MKCFKTLQLFNYKNKRKKCYTKSTKAGSFRISLFLIISCVIIECGLAGRACLKKPCSHGICIDNEINSIKRQCYCRNGFTGYDCEINWDECRINHCENGGKCIDSIAAYNCSCLENFVGTRCEYDLREDCEKTFPCSNNGTCSYNSTGLFCNCAPGFTGVKCEDDVSVCTTETSPCLNGGVCLDALGLKFTCNCQPGWTGRVCEREIDECISQPCLNGGVCLDKFNDYSCACPPDFTGKSCETKLQICKVNPCKNGAFCLEENGKQICYCVPDFHGLLCEEQYDECEPEPCKNGGTCLDGVGSFTCTCPAGFFGNECQCSTENEAECNIQSTYNFSASITASMTATPSIAPTLSPMVTFTPTQSSIFIYGSEYEVSPVWPSSSMANGESSYFENPISASNSIMLPSLSISTASSDLLSDIQSRTQTPAETETRTTMLYGFSPTQIPPDWVSSTPYFSGGESQFRTSLSPSGESDSSLWEEPESTKMFTAIGESTSFSLPSGSPISPSLPTPQTSLFPPDSPIFEPESNSSIPVSMIQSDLFSDYISGFSDIPFTSIEQTEFQSDPQTSAFLTSKFQSEFQSDPQTSAFLTSKFQSEFLSDSQTSVFLTSKLQSEFFESSPTSTFGIPVPSLTSIGYPFSCDAISTGEFSSRVTPSVDIVTSYDFPFTTLDSKLFESPASGLPPRTQAFSDYFSDSIGTDVVTASVTFPHQTDFDSESEFSSRPQSPYLTPSHYPHTPSDGIEYSSFLTLVTSSKFFPNTETGIFPNDTRSLYPSPAMSQTSLFSSEVYTPITFPPVVTEFVTSTGPTTSQYITDSFEPSATPTPPLGPMESSSAYDYSSDRSFGYLTPTITISSDMLPTATPTLPLPTNLTDPCLNYCQNNAKCYSQSIAPPLCLCSFKYTGERCEVVREKIKAPSLRGNSFLKYSVPEETLPVLDISTKMKTLLPDGTIMYSGANKGRTYAFIFIQGGLLTLRFSCGSQSMHFVETRTRVDNGYNFTLHFEMKIVLREKNSVHCVGQLKVNGSYSMSGEQIVGQQEFFENSSSSILREIYIGGVSPQLAQSDSKGDQLLAFFPGFRGCIYDLSINQEEVNIFDDAVDGAEISECGSLACLVNPCFGNSTCVPSDGSPPWECLCAPGFEGSRCQIPVCRYNPCLNGATCATNSRKLTNANSTYNNSDSLAGGDSCLCSLGFTGSLCQKPIKIHKPSFLPTTDFASFVAYRTIPNLSDWFQLKFHFVANNMSQFGLLMYIGNHRTSTNGDRQNTLAKKTEISEEGSDFFALSFLQGFIALTWNLGGGTRRIITPGRIDTRLEVHSLFVGRQGRTAWLKVDGMRNMTGNSAGSLTRLNVNTDLFIGGYKSFQLEGLPHDFPMHQGFNGCIFDLGFRVKNKLFLPNLTTATGRNVKNCYEEDC